MSQVSRPVQIALAAVLVLGALWFVALRPRQGSAPAPAPAPTPAPAAATPAPANTAAPDNGISAGIGGLARDVAKARGAVATSQANANALAGASAAASSSSPPSTPAASTPPAAGAAAGARAASTPAVTPAASGASHVARTPAAAAAAAKAATAPAVAIKTDLGSGKTVALLFWNPLASDDQAVRSALQALVKPHGTFVLYTATASQVVQYGSIVSTAQVLETPTLLLMRGKDVQTITDLQDPTDLRQYVWDLQAGGPGEVLTPKLAAYAPGTPRVVYLKRANAYCARVTGHSFPASATLASVVAENEKLLAGLAAIPPPPSDRNYLHTLIQAELRAEREVLAAASAPSPTAARNLILSAETNEDLAVGMAKTYGLIGCVSPSQR